MSGQIEKCEAVPYLGPQSREVSWFRRILCCARGRPYGNCRRWGLRFRCHVTDVGRSLNFGKSDELLEKLLRSDELSEKLWKNFYGRTNFRKSLRKGWEEVCRLRTTSEKAEKTFSVEERLRIIIGKGIARGSARGAVACATRRPEKSLQERRAAPEQKQCSRGKS